MTPREWLQQKEEELDEPLLRIDDDDLDNAILGISGNRIVYSTPRIIAILIQRDKLSYEDAWAHYDFNIEGSYMGEKTPIFVTEYMDSIDSWNFCMTALGAKRGTLEDLKSI